LSRVAVALVLVASGCDVVSGLADMKVGDDPVSPTTTTTTSSTTSTGGAGGVGGTSTGFGGAGGEGGGAAGSAPCVLNVTDAFEGDELSPTWALFGASGAVSVDDGKLEIDAPETTKAGRGIRSTESFDLHDCSVTVDVAALPESQKPVGAYFGVSFQAAQAASFNASMNDQALHFTVADGGPAPPLASMPLPAPRYWRLRESAGTLYFETSEGGIWTIRAQTDTPGFLSSVNVGLGVYCLFPTDKAGTFKVEAINPF
jgi:hypothetical protein